MHYMAVQKLFTRSLLKQFVKFLKKQRTKPEPIMNLEMVIKDALYSLDEFYQFSKKCLVRKNFQR